MQDAQAIISDPRCRECGTELELPPAIAALIGVLGDEPVCVDCRTKEETDAS